MSFFVKAGFFEECVGRAGFLLGRSKRSKDSATGCRLVTRLSFPGLLFHLNMETISEKDVATPGARALVIAIDDSSECERAVGWTVENIVRYAVLKLAWIVVRKAEDVLRKAADSLVTSLRVTWCYPSYRYVDMHYFFFAQARR